jgi:glycosyltransferase involved in cell wall biosynthesis
MLFSLARVLVLVDPTVQKRSGITSYCEYAKPLLEQAGLTVAHIKRAQEESISDFRIRLATLVKNYGPDLMQVEAPETAASTLYLPTHVNVHVRLHCARSLGALWEGLPVDVRTLSEERQVIAKAYAVSSPTKSAWRETNRLIDLSACHIFANPPPTHHGGYDGIRSGVVLIGRAQTLKGIQFLPRLLAYLPKSLPMILAGPGMKTAASRLGISNRVEAFDEVDEAGVRALLSGAQSCLVASPFETFSMVAAEALAADTPVVTWAHSGTAELAPQPFVWTAPAWDVAALACVIERSIESKLPSCLKVIANLENSFTSGHLALREGMKPSMKYTYLDKTLFTPSLPQKSNMTYQTAANPFQRKLRKLIRDPRLFFADAKVINKVMPSLAIRLRKGTYAQGPEKILPKEFLSEPIFVGIKFEVAIRWLSNEQGISINDLSGLDARTRSLFVLNRSAAKSELALLREMQRCGEKFHLLSPINFVLAMFSGEEVATPEEYLRGISSPKREKLSAVQNIVVTVKSLNFGRALRACNFGSRLFLIVRPDESLPSIPSEDIDVLIVPIGYSLAQRKLRRVLRYPSVSADNAGIAGAVLRACQEAAPKALDVLLPVLGKCNYDPALLDVDTRVTQGILLCNQQLNFVPEDTLHGRPLSFDEQIALLEPRLEGVLLCESVMWRYRSLIDAAQEPSDWISIIKLAAYDGIRFETKPYCLVDQRAEIPQLTQ